MARGAVSAGILVGVLSISSVAHAQDVEHDGPIVQTFGRELVGAGHVTKTASQPHSVRWRSLIEDAGVDLPRITLPPIDLDAILREDRQQAHLRYGVGRDVIVHQDDGRWIDLPSNEGLWVIDLISPGAVMIRVGIEQASLPSGAQLVIHAPDSPLVPPARFDAHTIPESGTLWSPSRSGERVRVEYLEPREITRKNKRGLPFEITHIQHIYRDPIQLLAQSGGEEGGAAPCLPDVTCFPQWANVARAVAGVGVIDSDSIFCTGTMLDTETGDLTPYGLTAGHCLNSPEEAQSAEIYWFYQSSVCDGPPAALATVPQSAGCTLLATSSATDFTLMMIEGALPENAYWAGWTSEEVPLGTFATCIHHSAGDYKRISFGNAGSYEANPGFVQIHWYEATTQGGASGSGIFRDDTQQLFGQLCCGVGSCASFGTDSYGAFSQTYPQIASLLVAGSDDGLEENDSCETARATATGAHHDLVVKSTDEDWYQFTLESSEIIDIGALFNHAFGDIDISLHDGCTGGPIAISDSADNNEAITFQNNGPASEYQLRVFLASDTRNDYDLIVSINDDVTSAAHDECVNAIQIHEGATSFHTFGATSSGPDERASCGQSIEADVWYRYTAACAGEVTIDLCGSKFDTIVAVYEDDCPTVSGEHLACNDNADCDGDGSIGAGEITSRVNFAAQTGSSYLIRIGGVDGAQGVGSMNISCGLVNDDCDDAIVIGDGATTFTTIGATTDGPPHALCLDFGSDQVASDVWYRYQATCDGTLTVSTCGTAGYDTKLALYAGTNCPPADADLLDCNEDTDGCSGFTSIVSADVECGAWYTIRIGGYEGAQGAGTITITCDCARGGSGSCPADPDLDGDGLIGFADLLLLLDVWGACDPKASCPADLDDSGSVGFADLLILLDQWS